MRIDKLRKMSEDVEIIESHMQIIEISDDECLVADEPQPISKGNINESVESTNGIEKTHGCVTAAGDNKNFFIVCGTGVSVGTKSIVANSQKIAAVRKRKKRRKKKKSKRNIPVNHTLNSAKEIEQNVNSQPIVTELPSTSSTLNNIVSSTSRTNNNCDNYDYSKLNWLRPLNSLSSPSHLQIVVIDRGHPFWRIRTDKWLIIEKRLLEHLNTEMLNSNDSTIGEFDGAKWQNGIKIIGCHNENAFNFILKYVASLDKPWCGANLDAFPMSNINRHIVRMYVPPPILKTDLVMSLIKLQNPSISTKNWNVIKERKRAYDDGVDIWLSINTESFSQLCEARGEIKYGINRAWLNPCY